MRERTRAAYLEVEKKERRKGGSYKNYQKKTDKKVEGKVCKGLTAIYKQKRRNQQTRTRKA